MVAAVEPLAAAGEPAAGFGGYAGAPDFEVLSRKDRLRLYPCMNCHRFLPTKTTPRKLVTALPHPSTLRHGAGRLWCFQCHDTQDMNLLGAVTGEKIDFDEEHLVCGQCHHARHRDWYFGVHGKRLGNWRGKRRIVLCSQCHNPHDPIPKPRKPREKPPVRFGLDPMTQEGAAQKRVEK